MKRTWSSLLAALLITALVLPAAIGCSTVQAAEGYVVLVPQSLHAGSTASPGRHEIDA